MKLEEIKQGLAYKEGYGDWFEDMLAGSKEMCSLYHLDQLIDKVAKAYAKAKLEEAAERAEVEYEPTWPNGEHAIVNKQSITETPLD